MKTLVALVLAAFIASPAVAANVTNADGDAHVLVVTEDGEQSEVGVNPGQTVDICPNGCFVNMPNGDREALTGSETIEISAPVGTDLEAINAAIRAGLPEGAELRVLPHHAGKP